MILTLPLIEILHNNFPDAKIDFLVNSRVKLLIENYPNINNLLTIEKESIKEIYSICNKGKYDFAVAVRPLFSIAFALFLSGIRYRLGTGYRWYSFLFNFRHYEHRRHSVKHELEYNLNLLSSIGIRNEKVIDPVLYVSDADIKKIKEKLISMRLDTAKMLIIIHPSTKGSALVWDNNNFTDLLNLLLLENDTGYQIVITGTKEDETELNHITENIKSKNNVFIISDLDLKEFAALIKLSKVLVCNSTGPIHIAAALGIFCIGFYSPRQTENEKRWGPRTAKKIIFTLSESDKRVPSPEQVSENIINLIENKNA
jgi:ADP-heptose:LPS heptosyltransferase